MKVIKLDSIIHIADKKDWLEKQNYHPDIINFALSISEEWSVFIAREIVNWHKSVKKWEKNYLWSLKNQDASQSDSLMDQKDPLTKVTFFRLAEQVKHAPALTPISSNSWRNICDWLNYARPDVMKLTLIEVKQACDAWHEELKNKEVTSKYATHDVVHTLSNGWEIVKLSAQDLDREGEEMGHCVGSYTREVQNGKTQIYSLRDPQNGPHVTIEMTIPNAKERKKNGALPINITQIQGKEDNEPIDKYKKMVKEWFDALKAKGHKFNPIPSEESAEISTLEKDMEEGNGNGYGIGTLFNGIGGGTDTYHKNINSCEEEGWGGNWFYQGRAQNSFDALLEYAIQANQLKDIEKAVEHYSEEIYSRLDDWKMQNREFFSEEEPNEEDFKTYSNNLEFELGQEIAGQEYIFRKEEFNQAVKEFEQKRENYEIEIESGFEPLAFSQYCYEKVQDAIKKNDIVNPEEQEEQEEQVLAMSNNLTKFSINYDEIPKPEELSAYVESLKLYLEQGQIKDETLEHIVKKLPSAKAVKTRYSQEEVNILYQSVAYVWEEITGQSLLKQEQIESPPARLEGNYWMISNGVILSGPNHYTIIKDNINLFKTLLGLHAFAIHELLASDPKNIIKYVLDHGAMRIFINKDQKAYFQLSSDTYGKWGKKKIRKLDVHEKNVKVIDKSKAYKGWDSGITIKL